MSAPERDHPRRNATLLGHAAAEQALLQAAGSGRLAHAWLLTGPPGIGKATLAFRFARFLLAGGSGSTLALPEDHPVFRRVAAGGHADLLTVERPFDEKKGRLAADLPVDEVRRVAPFLRLTAGEGGWRIVVIDDADRMNRSSANALLKILEEPPAGALLMLATSQPGLLPPTIRSRARVLALQPLAEAEVAAWLAERRPELDGAAAAALARLAEGSPGRALALADQDGLALFHAIVETAAALPRLDLVRLHKLADQLAGAAAEESYRTFSHLLLWWLGRLVRHGARGAAPAEVVAGEGALLQRLARGGLDRWLEVWDKSGELFRRADSANLDRKQAVLSAFLAMEAAARA